MIGFLFQSDFEPEIVLKLKQELSKAPYAGCFILLMIQSDFAAFNEEDLGFFEDACDNIYELEMKILVLLNFTLFRDFIKEFAQNRRHDRIKEAALKFSDCLSSLPKLAAIVEDGREESFLIENLEEEKGGPDADTKNNGREEIKFFKKDLAKAPKFCAEILKHAIIGNLELFKKAVADSGFSRSELNLVRGL